MATIPDNSIVRVTFYTRLGNQNGLLVTHWKATLVQGTGPTDAQVAAKLSTVFAPLIKACMSSTATFVGVTCQQFDPVRTDKASAVGDSGNGTVVGSAAPSQSAGVLSVRTGLASKRTRGRKYIPFPSVTNILADGSPSANQITAWTNLANALLTEQICGDLLNDGHFNYGVYSGLNRSWVKATNILVRTKFGTVRRRSSINRGDQPVP